MKTKHTFRLSQSVADQLAELAIRKRASQAAIVEAALVSLLSPDASERMEAAFTRRFDRFARQLEHMDRKIEIGNEALALFVRFWLAANPALPESSIPATQAKSRERFDDFVRALTRRLEGIERLGQ